MSMQKLCKQEFKSFWQSLSFEATTLGNTVKELHFSRGLIGFEKHLSFEVSFLGALVKMSCHDPFYIRFYGLPMAVPVKCFYQEGDIQQILETYRLLPEKSLIMPLIAGEEKDGLLELRANLKAPIVIDVTRKKAWQFVFVHDNYPLRFILGSVKS